MKQLYRLIIAAAMAVSMTACAGLQLEKAQKVEPVGSAFDTALYAAYIDLSKREFAEGDYKDSDEFANRAMKVATGTGSAPEQISNRKLPADKVDELTNARKWLVDGFAKGAKIKAPEAAAKAQGDYECWMQEQEENFQPKDIAECRSDFLAAMAKVDEATREALPRAAAAAPKQDDAKARIDGIYLVFFDFNSSTLNDAAMDVIHKAAFDYHLAKPAQIVVTGHTDAAGSNAYNMALSERRIQSVIKAMGDALVPAEKFSREAMANAKPLVRDGLNKREAKNRRVEIIFY